MASHDIKILKNLWIALKQFYQEDGPDKCSILAYYSIFTSLFLLAFFSFLFTRLLGNPEIALKGIYPFSPAFFANISPGIYERAEQISVQLRSIGVIGIISSCILSFLVIKKVIRFVNDMFHLNVKNLKWVKGFFIRRLTEFGLLFFIGLVMAASFFFTGFVSSISAHFSRDSQVDPRFIQAVDSFLIKYLLPFLITFVFFYVLYTLVPEKKIYLKGGLIAAVISTILWEALKRVYAYYLVHMTIFGKIKGTIIALILFGFWIELSMGIMLYGAKLAYIFDKERNDKIKKNYHAR